MLLKIYFKENQKLSIRKNISNEIKQYNYELSMIKDSIFLKIISVDFILFKKYPTLDYLIIIILLHALYF